MRYRKGLTLIELLIVIAIIGLLAGLLFPVLAKARATAHETTCLSQQHQLVQMLLADSQDHDGTLPAGEDWHRVANGARLLRCPAQRADLGYVYNGRVAGKPVSTCSQPTRTLLLADGVSGRAVAKTNTDLAFPHRAGHAIAAYLDGHSARCSPDQLDIFYPGDALASPAEVQQKFGIEMRVMAGRPTGNNTYVDALPLLLRELSLYEAGMLRRNPASAQRTPPLVNRIILYPGTDILLEAVAPIPEDAKPVELDCSHAWLHGPNYIYFEGPQSGITLIFNRYLLTPTTVDAHSREFEFRNGVHDAMLDGFFQWGRLQIPSDKWKALNPAGYTYPSDCEGHFGEDDGHWRIHEDDDRTSAFLHWGAAMRGFSIGTDQGYFYGLAMTDPGYVEARGDYDAKIKQKTALLREALQAYHPAMNDTFWQSVARANAREHYIHSVNHTYIPIDSEDTP